MSKENLYYIGKFGETIEHSEGDDMVKEAELFSTGIHRGVEYTEEDLNELVNNFSKENNVPIQLDHSKSARDTVGFLEEVSQKDGKLLGKLRIIDEYAQGRIAKKLMNKLSVSFYLKHTEGGYKPHNLREVSLVAFPQLKSARLFSENGYESDYEEQGGSNVTDKIKQEFNLEDIVKQVRAQIESETAVQYSELEKKLVKLEGVQAKFNETQVNSKIEKFQADSKVVPAQAEALKTLLASFSEEQFTAFEEFMSNSAKVDFNEAGEFEQHNEEGKEKKDERTQEEKDFEAFYEEHTKKFGTTL